MAGSGEATASSAGHPEEGQDGRGEGRTARAEEPEHAADPEAGDQDLDEVHHLSSNAAGSQKSKTCCG